MTEIIPLVKHTQNNYPMQWNIPCWDTAPSVHFRGNFCHGEAEISNFGALSLGLVRPLQPHAAHIQSKVYQAVCQRGSAMPSPVDAAKRELVKVIKLLATVPGETTPQNRISVTIVPLRFKCP